MKIPFGILCFSVSCAVASSEWRDLFDGESLDGWKTVIDKLEPGEDPQGFAQVRDGLIHMYADTPETETVPFGVIVHEEVFSRYHLKLETRWGPKKFAPRANQLRDAGLLYHCDEVDRIWPPCLEYQIQEGDSGDIVLLGECAMTWMRPSGSEAPEGQGEPGMLPEAGGIPKDFAGTGFAYIGRLPELDWLDGWNEVEIIVQADESAVHRLNGRTIARLTHLEERDGRPLREGRLALQLEAAEVFYRNIRIRELGEPLRAEQAQVSLSAVRGHPSRTRTLSVSNPGEVPLDATLTLNGTDADAFRVRSDRSELAPGETMEIEIHFDPTRGFGRYSAGLQVGGLADGCFVILQGVGQNAFEGRNEPPLQLIVDALGVPLRVGGEALELDTREPSIGDGVPTRRFRAAEEGPVRVTPLARYSPPGVTPFGWVAEAGEWQEVGALADISPDFPDTHQALFPALDGGASHIEFEDPGMPFALYMKGHQYIAATDPELGEEAPIAHTARVYPVTSFQGRRMTHSYLVGFEEARNGDYQDALFLVENLKPADEE